jgi:hypothetical protein
MSEGGQFKYIVQGTYEISFEYPIIYDAQGFQNNILKLNRSQDMGKGCHKIKNLMKDEPMVVMPLLQQNLQIFEEKQGDHEQGAEVPVKKDHVKSDTTTDQDLLGGKLQGFEYESSKEEQISEKVINVDLPISNVTTNSKSQSNHYLNLNNELGYFFSTAVSNKTTEEGKPAASYFLHSLAIGVSFDSTNQSNYPESVIHNCMRLVEQIAVQKGKGSQHNLSAGLGLDSFIQDSLLFDMEGEIGISIEDSQEKKNTDRSRSFLPTELDPTFLINKATKQCAQRKSLNLLVCSLKMNELCCTTLGCSGFYLVRMDSNKNAKMLKSYTDLLIENQENLQKTSQIEVQEGDLLIAGSELVFNVCRHKDILGILTEIYQTKSKKPSPKEIHDGIIERLRCITTLVRKSTSLVLIVARISQSI